MCVQFDVSNTNILGIIGINMTKIKQIWLPNEECFRYCPNYWCQYTEYIYTYMCKTTFCMEIFHMFLTYI